MQQNYSEVSFRLATLILKKLHGHLTESEAQELNNWINDNDSNRQLFTELSTEQSLTKELDEFAQSDTKEGWQRMQHKLMAGNQSKVRRLKVPRHWLQIAAVLILLASCWVLRHAGRHVKEKIPSLANRYKTDVMPGGKKAELTLSNGQTVPLETGTDSLFEESGNALKKTADGMLVYHQKKRGLPMETTGWNTIHTPNGGEYRVVLEDGTKVWLNAASSLHYPVQFTGKERKVELTEGEAYFEIAQNKEKPFILTVNRMEVQVLGTAFNVNTYGNTAPITTATLVEGRIKVKALNKITLLQPGEQIKASQAVAQVTKADVEAVTAWKNGLFIFNNEPLPAVMQQLARWYNVSIVYSKSFNQNKFFTGEIKRQVPISQLLQMMEMTGIARFSVTNNTVTILPYTN